MMWIDCLIGCARYCYLNKNLFYFSERDKIFANMPPKQKRKKVTAINNMALKKKKNL